LQKLVAQNMKKRYKNLKRFVRREDDACALCVRREHAAAFFCAP